MNRALLLVLLAAMSGPFGAAAPELGASLDVSCESISLTEDNSKATRTILTLMPSMIVRTNPRLDIEPFALLGLEKERDRDHITADLAEDYERWMLGLGVGLFYRCIQVGRVGLLLGPMATVAFVLPPSGDSAPTYDTYRVFTLTLALPVMLDVALTERLFLRAGIEIPGLSYYNETIEDESSSWAYSTLTLQTFTTGFSPFFGFYFMFPPNPAAKDEQPAEPEPKEVPSEQGKDEAEGRASPEQVVKPKPRVDHTSLPDSAVNTARFKAIGEQYLPTRNPAYLGIIQYDNVCLSAGGASVDSWKLADGDLRTFEQDLRASAGYAAPVGRSMGVAVDAVFYTCGDRVGPIHNGYDAFTNREGVGAITSFGWAVSDTLSLGLAVSAYRQEYRQKDRRFGFDMGGYISPTETPLRAAFAAGLLAKNPETTLLLDLQMGWSLEEQVPLEATVYGARATDPINAPLFVEATLARAFDDRRTWVVAKLINDIYFDRDCSVCRLMPAAERWVTKWLALRAGVEGSLTRIDGGSSIGCGGTGGVSLRSARGWEVDTNVTYRVRPSHVLPDESLWELIPLVIVSRHDLASRR